MVFKYLFSEAVANAMAWKYHLLYREAEVGREVFETHFQAFLSQVVSQMICIPLLTVVLSVESIFFKMYFFLSKLTLKSSGVLGFWNKFNRNTIILSFGQVYRGQLQNPF